MQPSTISDTKQKGMEFYWKVGLLGEAEIGRLTRLDSKALKLKPQDLSAYGIDQKKIVVSLEGTTADERAGMQKVKIFEANFLQSSEFLLRANNQLCEQQAEMVSS